MSATTRMLFALGARLHMSVAAVERLSMRELVGWVDFFKAAASTATAEPDDGIPDVRTMPRAQLRRMFNHVR